MKLGGVMLGALAIAGWLIPLASFSAPAGAHTPPAFVRQLEYEPPAPGTYPLPVIMSAVDGDVLDSDGTRRRLFEVLGNGIALLSFVYTSCSDADGCPLATHVMRQVAAYIDEQGNLSGQLRIVTLSFDPERDTPEAMRRYAGESEPAGNLVFLTTASREVLQPILDGYGQYIVREPDPAGAFGGGYSHILKVFLIDRHKRVRNVYSVSFLYPQIIINDVKTLMMQKKG